MPNAYVRNQTPSGYGAAVSLLVEMLVSAGWAYRASGDGLSGYSATGKVFTNTGSGALGWNNLRAWARLATPDGREIVIQHNAAGGMRLKYSAQAKFTGGSPAAANTPSATDERYLWGAGPDIASTAFSAYFHANTTSGGVKFQGAALAMAPYGFWFASALTSAGAIQTALMMDPVTSVPEDTDPVVWHIADAVQAGRPFGIGLGSFQAIAEGSFPTPGSATSGCFCHMDAARTKFLSVHAAGYTVGWPQGGGIGNTWVWEFASLGLALNPFNGKHDTLPIVYARPNVYTLPTLGIKGWSSLMRWTTLQRTNFLDTLDSKKWICVNMVWLPWDGVTTPTN